MRYLPGDTIEAADTAAGWLSGAGWAVDTDWLVARGLVVDGTAGGDDPLEGIEQVLRGLESIGEWLDATRVTGRASTDPAVHRLVQGLLVGLGHVDAAALAVLSGVIVRAEEVGCGLADGQVSPAAWVAQQLRMTGAAATRACRLAADLDERPAVTADLRAGRISRDHATTLAAALRQQHRDQDAAARAARQAETDLADEHRRAAAAAEAAARDAAEASRIREDARRAERHRREAAAAEARRRDAADAASRRRREQSLLGRARAGGTPEDVAAEADRQRAAERDALARTEAAQRAGRSLRTWTDPTSGAGRGTWSLPKDQHDMILAALQAAISHDHPDGDPEERRSYEQRQADAFTDVIALALRTGELPSSRGQKPHVTVTVPLATLTSDQDGVGYTREGSLIAAETARRIACDAGLTRIVLGAASQVLDVGRETRNWTTAQYKAAELTFGGCAFPVANGKACARPVTWTELHHITYWRHGGRTDQINGALLCRFHHTLIHHDGWQLSYDHTQQTITVTRQRRDGTMCTRTVSFARPHPAAGTPATDTPAATQTPAPTPSPTPTPTEDRLPV